MDRHMRRKVYIFCLMAFVAYVGFFEVMFPEKGGYMKKMYEEKIVGSSQSGIVIPMQAQPAEVPANPPEVIDENKVYYTLAPSNKTKDRVYELMLGAGGEE